MENSTDEQAPIHQSPGSADGINLLSLVSGPILEFLWKTSPSLTAREIYLSRGNCDGDGSIEKIAVKRGNAIVDFTYRFEIP